MRKICIVTSCRADYGLLYNLMVEIESDPDLSLKIVATGMHLSQRYGNTYKEIESDGFKISKKVDIQLSSTSLVSTGKTIGLGVLSFVDAYEELKPDLVVVLGDRYEILSCAIAATCLKLPIAHIHGGEITQGSQDEVFRHSITKMSHVHFTTCESYKKRVIQLGENPAHVHNFGAPGVESILDSIQEDKSILLEQLNISNNYPIFLITFHPATLDYDSPSMQFSQLLLALEKFEEHNLVFTKPNSDAGATELVNLIDEFVSSNENAYAFTSLGNTLYRSAMKNASVMIGNSSSGILEAASFKLPVVNIGDRQAGRLHPDNVVTVMPVAIEIEKAIRKCLSKETSQSLRNVENPYYQPSTARNIKEVLKTVEINNILRKVFFDL